MEGQSGVTRSNDTSLLKFILRISYEIKSKVKVVLFEVSLMDFILRISKELYGL